MQAKDIMTTKVISIRPDTTVKEIARIMLKRHISAVPVVNANDAIVGIVSEGDLMRRPESETERHRSWWLFFLQNSAEQALNYVKDHGRFARDVMTSSVVSVSEDISVSAIAALLEEHRIKRVPVVRDGRLVGIVSRANLLHVLAATKELASISSDDQTIRSSILETLQGEAGVQDQFVNVIVSNGVVALWGAVNSRAEKHAAQVVAENTAGVASVDNHLSVLPIEVRRSLGAE